MSTATKITVGTIGIVAILSVAVLANLWLAA
ncbi:hypothetical protein [Halorussus gelatinilyticus]